MKSLYKLIDNQFAYNKRRNIFYRQVQNTNWFAPATSDLLAKNHLFLQQVNAASNDKIIDFMLNKALNTFYSINQYYYFGRAHQAKLEEIYQSLLIRLKAATSVSALNTIALAHQSNLQNWLKASNPFAEKVYANTGALITRPVTCAEYSAAHQIKILNLDLATLKEPVLDVGCGQEAYLVNYLRNLGIDAYGIDRSARENSYLFKTDWFDFSFKDNYWGTIISNIGFSNQFVHHHVRTDGDFIAYAKKYMEILKSLQLHGAFYYAPHLPFIEEYLEEEKFEVVRKVIPGTDFTTAKIKRRR